jgi:alcohol dehydrogenase
MKSVQYSVYGGVDVLNIVTNTAEPSIRKGQLLVEVKAASINPIDYKVRQGYMKQFAPVTFPSTIGGDFAGIVTKVSDDVTGFKVGDHVYGQAIVLNGGSGTFAEFVTANAANTARKPEKISFLEAASLPLAGASAVQALEELIKLKKGQKILIHGGAGGIGSIAIQLAKSAGATVTATVSEKDIPFVKAAGADVIIDYHKQAFEKDLHDFDAVFDTVGGETAARSFPVIKKGGILVSMGGQPDKALAEKAGVIAIGQMTSTDTNHLKRLAELVDNGSIKPLVDKVFSLDQAKEAFTYAEQSHPQGKVVLKIK